MEKLTEFDMAEYLDTEELQKGYLDYNAKEGTPEDLLSAINTVARARGMTKTAKEAGITRDGLYKALSPDGNPTFSTVCKILRAIGYTLTPTPIAHNVNV
ncbi:addiction module antidote protein [Treponema sp. C6A8]|uniref:addiction module antidote protein n=1 Tax=Treponema sp. C6A8 TaxID=1410609 RepID=UPI00047FEB02|nr:addiction module antidote protein [Treponema sp. C6A8]